MDQNLDLHILQRIQCTQSSQLLRKFLLDIDERHRNHKLSQDQSRDRCTQQDTVSK